MFVFTEKVSDAEVPTVAQAAGLFIDATVRILTERKSDLGAMVPNLAH